jgi:hypothetical protein
MGFLFKALAAKLIWNYSCDQCSGNCSIETLGVGKAIAGNSQIDFTAGVAFRPVIQSSDHFSLPNSAKSRILDSETACKNS